MSTARVVLWAVVAFILGAALSVLAVIGFLRSEAGTAVLRAYVVPPPQWPSVLTEGTSTEPPQGIVSNITSTTTLFVPVPRAFASAEYATAISGVVATFDATNAVYLKLLPLLVTINNKSLARDYTGFFDLIAQAKTYVSEQKTLNTRFVQSLDALNTANQSTTDAITRSTTNTLVTQGKSVGEAGSAFLALLDDVLSGNVPTQQQITNLNTQGQQFGLLSQEFSTSAKALLKRFTDQADPTAQ